MGVRQGITTLFLGIDGMSYAPLSPGNYRMFRRWLGGLLGDPPEDLDMSSVAAFRGHYHRQVAVNTAYLVPQGTVRLEVLGFRDVPLRGDALDRARRLVREGLEQGAVGLLHRVEVLPGAVGGHRGADRAVPGRARGGGRVHVRAAQREPRAGPRRPRGDGGGGDRAADRRPPPLRALPDRGRRRRAGDADHGAHRPGAGRRAGRHVRHLPVPAGSSIPVSLLPERGAGGRARRDPRRLRDPASAAGSPTTSTGTGSLPMAEVVFSYLPRQPAPRGHEPRGRGPA